MSDTSNSTFDDPRVKAGVIVGVVLIVIAIIVLIVVLVLMKRKKDRIKIYPKDTVILHQIPRGLRAPSVSPFALKLETWLRMANIKYQNEFSIEFSKKSLIPWIRYNGVAVADSQFCIEYLSKTLGINLNKNYSEKEIGISRCVLKTAEESLRWCLVLHRYIYSRNPKESGMNSLLLAIFYFKTKKRCFEQGYGRHTKEEVYAIGMNDLKAINDIIGDNKFLLGNEVCDVDAAVFGQLTQLLYHDFGPLNQYLKESCRNLMRYTETMKQTYWPDWEQNLKDPTKMSLI